VTFTELDHLLAIEDPMERARQGNLRHGKTWAAQAEAAMTPGVRALLDRIVALQRRINELEAQ
jgi:hypothetical protein